MEYLKLFDEVIIKKDTYLFDFAGFLIGTIVNVDNSREVYEVEFGSKTAKTRLKVNRKDLDKVAS